MNRFRDYMNYLKEADCYLASRHKIRHIKKASCKTQSIFCRIENFLKCFDKK